MKPKLKKEKTTRNQFGRSSKSSVHQIKKVGNSDNLGLKINEDIIADHGDLAEKFNGYFINIAAKLKEPTEYGFRSLQDYINSHIPENLQFDLP